MTADEFVAALRSASQRPLPTPHDEVAQAELHCVALRDPAREPRPDPLEDLRQRYDCARLQIGRVRLLAVARPHFAGSVVGFWESELLVHVPSGELVVFEHERFGERLMGCAQSSAQFLDALSAFWKMVWQRAIWMERTDEAARLCAALAGGAQYEEFYLGLMSYLEYGA